MSADSHPDDHGHAHDSHEAHASNEGIPESSLQDLILKGVTIAAAVVLIGSGFWWKMQPLPEAGHEAGANHEQSHEAGQNAGQAEHAPAH